MHFLATRLQSAGVSIAALQETRLPSDSDTPVDGYRFIGTKSDRGNLGVGLMIRQDLASAVAGVWQVNPRFLMIRVECGARACIICSFHAPQAGRPHEEQADFWNGFRRYVRSVEGKHSDLLLLGDANAAVDWQEYDPEYLPRLQDADETDYNGNWLQAVCDEFRVEPAHPSQDAPAHTYQDGERLKRLDYILTRGLLTSCVLAQPAEQYLARAQVEHAHMAICASLQLEVPPAKQERPFPRLNEDQRYLACLIYTINRPAPHPDPTLFLGNLTDCMPQAVRAAFANPHCKQRSRKPWWNAQCNRLCALSSSALQALRRARARVRAVLLHQVLRRWRSWRSRTIRPLLCQATLHVELMHGVAARSVSRLNRIRSRAICEAKAAYFDDTAAAAQRDWDAGRPQEFWKYCRQARRSPAASVPVVAQNGTIIAEPHALRDRWRQHWCGAFGTHTPSPAPPPATEDWSVLLPDEDFLRRMLQRVHPAKAAGPDGLPSGLWRDLGPVVYKDFHQFLVAMANNRQLPTSFLGGRVCYLLKDATPQSSRSCEDYRAITLMDHAAKLTQRAMQPATREALIRSDVFQHAAGVMCGTAWPLHRARAWQRQAARRGLPCAFLFVDARAAFDSIARGAVSEGSSTQVEQPAAEWLLHWSAHGWLELRIGERTLRQQTGNGVRQGDVYSAQVYILASQAALDALREWCNDQDADVLSGSPPMLRTWTTLWACSRFLRTRPETLICSMALCVKRALSKLHLQLNLKRDKTCAMFSWCGAGAVTARTTIAVRDETDEGHIPLQDGDGPADRLPVQRHYKYLGTLLTPTMTLLPEAKHRARLAKASAHALRRTLLRSSHVSIAVRWRALASARRAQLLYGCESWSHVPDQCMTLLQSADSLALRIALGLRWGSEAWTTDYLELRSRVGTASIAAAISHRRLRHAHKIACSDLSYVPEIDCDEEWWEQVSRDFNWLTVGTESYTPTSVSTARERLVASFNFSSLLSHAARGTGRSEWQRQTDEPTARALAPFECEDCGKICKGLAGLANHMIRAHGVPSLPSQLSSAVCQWCHFDFRNTARLAGHLRHGTTACQLLHRTYGVHPLTEEQRHAARALAAEHAAAARSEGLHPAQLGGPRRPAPAD